MAKTLQNNSWETSLTECVGLRYPNSPIFHFQALEL